MSDSEEQKRGWTEFASEIKKQFSKDIKDITEAILKGASDDQMVSVSEVKIAIADAFIQGVISKIMSPSKQENN
jgi:hypothetical protein